jgi:hypothetical protein
MTKADSRPAFAAQANSVLAPSMAPILSWNVQSLIASPLLPGPFTGLFQLRRRSELRDVTFGIQTRAKLKF